MFGGLSLLMDGVVLALADESRGKAEHEDQTGQRPGDDFNDVGGFSHTHDLVGASKVGGQTATFRFLDENEKSQCYADNDDKDC